MKVANFVPLAAILGIGHSFSYNDYLAARDANFQDYSLAIRTLSEGEEEAGLVYRDLDDFDDELYLRDIKQEEIQYYGRGLDESLPDLLPRAGSTAMMAAAFKSLQSSSSDPKSYRTPNGISRAFREQAKNGANAKRLFEKWRAGSKKE